MQFFNFLPTMPEDSERLAASDSESDDESPTQNAEVQEGRDYYLENGLLVFTATFLSKRGYCCESGCRHCPYDYNGKRAGE